MATSRGKATPKAQDDSKASTEQIGDWTTVASEMPPGFPAGGHINVNLATVPDAAYALAKKTQEILNEGSPDYILPKSVTDAARAMPTPTPTYTKLHFTTPETVSYITCSPEAAKYAYQHYATPYSTEWRAASAGYDAGRASALESIEHWRHQVDVLLSEATGIPIAEPETEPNPEFLTEDQVWQDLSYGTPDQIAEWNTLAVGEPPKDSLRVHTMCKRCTGTDGEHEPYCVNAR